MQHLSRTIAYRIQKKLAAKEVTVKKAKADSVKFKAATRKSHRAKERLERALQREMDFRHEDAHAAQEKLRQERHEFQLCLKAAISEVTVSSLGSTIHLHVHYSVNLLKLLPITICSVPPQREERSRAVVLRGKLQDQMEEQLKAIEKYYLDEINIINSRHDARIKKLDGQMVVSCAIIPILFKLFISNYIIHHKSEYAPRSQGCKREHRQTKNKTQECAYCYQEQQRLGYEV